MSTPEPACWPYNPGNPPTHEPNSISNTESTRFLVPTDIATVDAAVRPSIDQVECNATLTAAKVDSASVFGDRPSPVLDLAQAVTVGIARQTHIAATNPTSNTSAQNPSSERLGNDDRPNKVEDQQTDVQTAATPACKAPPDFLASPVRPASAIPPKSPLPPPSAGKRELNEAAMALTWLAEAFVGDDDASPIPPSSTRPTAAAAALLSAERVPATTTATTAGSQRTRRAASERCVSVLRQALAAERVESGKGGIGQGSTDAARAARRASRSVAAANVLDCEKKGKPYSRNSRVGRAMSSIFDYVANHQQHYVKIAGTGVPERIIRQEFGNNPDTSKALRYLVSERKIVRNGAGGRRDPYSYTLAGGSVIVAKSRARSPVASEEENAERISVGLHGNLNVTPAVGLSAGRAPTSATTTATPLCAINAEGAPRRKVLQPRLSLPLPTFETTALEQIRQKPLSSGAADTTQSAGMQPLSIAPLVGTKRSATSSFVSPLGGALLPAHKRKAVESTAGIIAVTPSLPVKPLPTRSEDLVTVADTPLPAPHSVISSQHWTVQQQLQQPPPSSNIEPSLQLPSQAPTSNFSTDGVAGLSAFPISDPINGAVFLPLPTGHGISQAQAAYLLQLQAQAAMTDQYRAQNQHGRLHAKQQNQGQHASQKPMAVIAQEFQKD